MLRLINPREDWNKRIAHVASNARKLRSLRVLSAFNAVTDYIAFLKPEKLWAALQVLSEEKRKKVLEKSLEEAKHAASEVDVLAALLHGLRTGKAAHFVASPEALKWLRDWFGEPNEKRLGGQAALMAAQLSDLGVKSLLYPAWFSVDQAQLVPEKLLVPLVEKKGLKTVKPIKAARPEDPTSASWIFEFKRGDSLSVNEETLVCPRDNRVIIAYPASYAPCFKKEVEPFLGKLAKEVDLLLLSGFHVLKVKNYKEVLGSLSRQLKAMKKANKKLRVHYEFVPLEEEEIEKAVLVNLAKNADSLGLNEVELVDALSHLGLKKEARAIQKNESAATLYEGALRVLKKLKLRRVHVHSLGYNTVLLSKTEEPEKVRDGVLFGAIAASLKSQLGTLDQRFLKKPVGLSVSEAGYNQIGIFESTIWDAFEKRKKKPISALSRKKFMSSGIFEEKDHFAVVVPAPIAQGVKTTVGLGDVVSACAMAFEVA